MPPASASVTTRSTRTGCRHTRWDAAPAGREAAAVARRAAAGGTRTPDFGLRTPGHVVAGLSVGLDEYLTSRRGRPSGRPSSFLVERFHLHQRRAEIVPDPERRRTGAVVHVHPPDVR